MSPPDLAGCFPGALARFAGTVAADDGSALPAAALLEPTTLDRLVARFAAANPGGEPRAVVSMWSQWHFAAVIVPAVAVRLIAGRSLPVGLEAARLRQYPNGCTAGLALPGVPALEALPAGDGFEALLDGHLAPLTKILAGRFGVSTKLLWTNAAASFAWTVEQCAASPDVDRAALAVAGGLLTAEIWAGARNPLRGALEPPPPAPFETCRRRVCCLRYLLPGVADCGSFCPLPAKARVRDGLPAAG